MSTHTNLENEQARTLHYRFTIFLGAFLLFSVQLLLGKYFLPWFGGTPAMWTTCMFFFQTLLLAGYAYAHGLANWFSLRAQRALHFTLLLASLLLLGFLALMWNSPITPDTSWRAHSGDHPVWSVIALLAVSAGLPYFVLSSTGPLLQSWFTKTHSGHTPYRLYALSNLGSFLALLSYPFLVEPWLTLKTQARLWSLAFLGYAVGCAYCALRIGRSGTWENASSQPEASGENATADRIGSRKLDIGTCVLWLTLAACASVMFLATTNQICQDIAVVPFLWVLPLSLYLLSFVICFDKPKWYSRGVFHPAFGLAIFLACFVLNGGALTSIVTQVLVYSFTLFACCMVCHGELARSKPVSRYLTSFYLMVALGGAMGGIFVALIAPHCFRAFWEYQLGLWGSVLLMFFILMRDKGSWLYCSRFGLPGLALGAALLPGFAALGMHSNMSLDGLIPVVAVAVGVWLLARMGQTGFDRTRARAVPLYCATALLVLGTLLVLSARMQIQSSALVTRNFYGVLTVRELNSNLPDGRAFALFHGRIAHGFQFRAEDKRGLPTSYYGLTSGVGRALTELREGLSRSANEKSLRIGVAGLGVGTLAAYAKPGDYIRFYEINPEVISIASDRQYFSYLKDCPAKLDVIVGDARLSMEHELQQGQPQRFDLLALDTFSGDAIPVHLLTKEAFQIYLSEIKKPDGIIAVHITNSYFDLRPVLSRIAEHFELKCAWLHSAGDGKTTSYNDWVLLSRDGNFLDTLSVPMSSTSNEAYHSVVPLWTDDYSNLFQVLRR
jgi:hypothetical protein